MNLFASIVTVATLAVASTATAQATLKVGDDAPAIAAGTWIKGSPVTEFESGRVYVMEFWATWCGPCIRGIPHLTELQAKYKDDGLTVIGMAVWQQENTQAGRENKVRDFVEKQGDKMNYTVAVDDDSTMGKTWMAAAGRNGIPAAFIVGKTGKIEWIGHPARMDDALAKAMGGSGEAAPAPEKKPDARKVLKVGDPAPPIKVGAWVKGKPVDRFEKGKIYVMEFWATWCGPCIVGIPHLTELQKEYKDKGVTIVGTAIWQREETQESRQSTVTEFVEKQGDKMDYTIAVDADRTMSDTWMRPAGRNGIPSAFIVGKTGKIEWMGHPGRMDTALEQIVAGTFDREKYAEQEARERAWSTDHRRAATAISAATRDGDGPRAMTLVDDLVKAYPDQPRAQQLKYRTMLQFATTADAVSGYGARIAKINWDDAMFLNSISWWTVDDPVAVHRNLEQATAWAERADALTDHKDAQIIDTLARCWWERGDTEKAIELQRKAVEHASPTMKSSIKSTLDHYLDQVSKG